MGPFFLNGNLTSESYLIFFFFFIEFDYLLDNVPLLNRINIYYQHDGAPAHVSVNVQLYLNERFGNR